MQKVKDELERLMQNVHPSVGEAEWMMFNGGQCMMFYGGEWPMFYGGEWLMFYGGE